MTRTGCRGCCLASRTVLSMQSALVIHSAAPANLPVHAASRSPETQEKKRIHLLSCPGLHVQAGVQMTIAMLAIAISLKEIHTHSIWEAWYILGLLCFFDMCVPPVYLPQALVALQLSCARSLKMLNLAWWLLWLPAACGPPYLCTCMY